MRARGAVVLLACLAVSCGGDGRLVPVDPSSNAPNASFCRLPEPEVEERVEDILGQMTLAEKVQQMAGTGAILTSGWQGPGNERLGIPPFAMTDGPRGVGFLSGHATAFPVAMARGASWDPELERRVGDAIGREARAKGASVLLAPTINLLRHPAWGRAQETYGEDSLHIGRLGVAFIEGAQQHLIASAKHFAANSIEDTRFDVNVNVDERTLREVYLPHFHAAVRAGVASVMTAYNKVNGQYSAENFHLVREILKDEWDFRGFVESDWILGTRSTVPSAIAGLDIEMPGPLFYDADLIAAVERGDVPIENIDDAVRRILRTKLCFQLDTNPPVVDPSQIESPQHLALAREVEQKAIVLLKNEGSVLPLDRASITKVAVIGPLADRVNIGDTGSSNVNPTSVVTPLQGIRAALPGVEVTHVTDDGSSAESQQILGEASAAIVVVGLTSADEGESLVSAGDRETLALSAEQEELIRRVGDAQPRTVVVLEGGSAITVESWLERVPAILMAWYPGQEGGHAIADVLFGDVNPGGKLPFSVPRSEGDLTEFVSDPTRLEVPYGYLHGYRWLDQRGTEPRFPFGFGLSYTTFAYSNFRLASSRDGVLEFRVDVANTGGRDGDEVVQLYVSFDGSSVERAPLELKGFTRVSVPAGASETAILQVPVRDLAYYDVESAAWVVEPIGYTAHVGPSSRELPLQVGFRAR